MNYRSINALLLLSLVLLEPAFAREDHVTVRIAAYNVEFGKSASPEQIGEILKPFKLDIIGFNEAPNGDWTSRVGKVLGMKYSFVGEISSANHKNKYKTILSRTPLKDQAETTLKAEIVFPRKLRIPDSQQAEQDGADQPATVAESKAEGEKEPFTIAVLPDTQFYCDTRLKLSKKWGNGDLRRYFFEQTRWVRDNRKRLNIAFLVHEGDIVQADAHEEWAIAKEAMSILDGKVPYCMCLGNHDMGFKKSDNKYGGEIAANRSTQFNTYFPRDQFSKRREFGGTFDPDRHDNSWYHFEAAGMQFLIVALECKPRDEVLDWANKIVTDHPEHRVIVLTHSYLKGDKTRSTRGMKIKGNLGEQMWQKFVRKHKNIFMVLCGHYSGEAVLTSTGDHGNQVHQVLSDYQNLNNGGESWLRYMIFKPKLDKIGIYTYNPALDKFRNGPSSRFDLDYSMTLPPLTVPKITRPGDANDVKKGAEQSPAGGGLKAAPEK